MLSTFLIVLPVFAVIFAGWAARRTGVLGPAATSELNRFVVWLALPALLFDVMASAKPAEIWRPGFIAAFSLGVIVVFAGTVFVRLRMGVKLADAAVDGLNTGYANTAYIGIPLLLALFGQRGLPPAAIASILTICVLFAAAIATLEFGLAGERAAAGNADRNVLLVVGGRMVRNPIVVAPVLGAVFPLTGMAMPEALDRFVSLLGAAASPCALVALGLFLASKPGASEGGQAAPAPTASHRTVAGIVAVKLLVHPALTWLIATYLLRLPPFTTHAAVLIAALPTGTGPFMLAEFYRREAGLTARVMLVSTLLSVLTVTAYIAWVIEPG
jgi:malonate transporter and related proteins